MALAIDAEEAAGFVDVSLLADAGENVVQLLVLRFCIADAVRGDQRQFQSSRQIDETNVVTLFASAEMALQLEVRSVFEDAGDPVDSSTSHE